MKCLLKNLLLTLAICGVTAANAAVLDADGFLYDYDADGDGFADDMNVGQYSFSLSTGGDVIIDVTTDGEFDSVLYLFDMTDSSLVDMNDDEAFLVTDSYLAVNLAAGDYMVAVGSILTAENEALLGYMQDFTFEYSRNASSSAIAGEWAVTILTPDAVEVPVPAAIWMFASGLLGLAAVRRR